MSATFSFGDYDQSLGKIGKILLTLKFSNAKAIEDHAGVICTAKEVFSKECQGLCYVREAEPSHIDAKELFFYRSALGFIYYSKCSNITDLRNSLQEYGRCKSSFRSSSFVSRCIINAIYMPREHVCHELSGDDAIIISDEFDKTLGFALKSVISDAVALAKALLAEHKAISPDSIDIIEAALHLSSNTDERSDLKKHRKIVTGKWLKHIGELHLVNNNPQEAEQYFTKSMEYLKGANDPWLAAAKELLVACSLMNCIKMVRIPDQLHSNSSITIKQWSYWASLLEDAANIYSSCHMHFPLYLECLLRTAHFHLLNNNKCNASKVLATFTSADFSTISGISTNMLSSDMASRYLKSARVHESFGWHRKAAFYYRMAAMQSVKDSSQPSEWLKCYHVLMKAVRGYGLAKFSNEIPSSASTSGFIQLQTRLLMDLYTASIAFQNEPLALRHACQALDTGGHTLFPYQLANIFSDMQKLASHSGTLYAPNLEIPLAIDSELVLLPLGPSLYPRILAIRFHPETISRSSSIIRPNSMSQQSNSFIYSPFNHPDKFTANAAVYICVNEDIKLVIDVENPFAVQLKIDSMSLITSSNAELVEGGSVVDELIFPFERKSITLTCRYLASGSMVFVGSLVTICGVTRKIMFADAITFANKNAVTKPILDIQVIPSMLPFLLLKPNANEPIEIPVFLGEKFVTLLEIENLNPSIQPAVVDLTVRGVPSIMEKAVSITFQSDTALCVEVDTTSLPSLFTTTFEVFAKFVYSGRSSLSQTSDDQYLRSLTFVCRIDISSFVSAKVVGIERYKRDKLLFDVQFESTAQILSADDSIDISDHLPLTDSAKGVLNAANKLHLHCEVDNELLAKAYPNILKLKPEVLDLGSVIKFRWSYRDNSTARTGLISPVVSGFDLISQLLIPPFIAAIKWWKTEEGSDNSLSYDFGVPIKLNIAEPVTFFIRLTKFDDEFNDAALHLCLDNHPQLNPGSSLLAYLISAPSYSECLNISNHDDVIDHTFTVIPTVTGQHRLLVNFTSSNGTWPLCPAIYYSCVDA